MDKYAARSTKMEGFHGQKFLHHAHADTLQTELEAAVAYATQVSRSAEWVDCLGKSAGATKPTDVLAKMTGPHASDSVMFGGTLSMLDLSDRVKPMDQLDVGRMWWACEVLDQDRSLRRLLGSIVVAFWPKLFGSWQFWARFYNLTFETPARRAGPDTS